jgi:hypothetical protein
MINRELLKRIKLGFPVIDSYSPVCGDVGRLRSGVFHADPLVANLGKFDTTASSLGTKMSYSNGLSFVQASNVGHTFEWLNDRVQRLAEVEVKASGVEQSIVVLVELELVTLTPQESRNMLASFSKIRQSILEKKYVVTGIVSAKSQEVWRLGKVSGTFDFRPIVAHLRGGGQHDIVTLERIDDRRIVSVHLGRFDWRKRFASHAGRESDLVWVNSLADSNLQVSIQHVD